MVSKFTPPDRLTDNYQPTRESKTEQAYHNRAVGRLNAFLTETNCDWDLHQTRFLTWLESYRGTVSVPAWRQNRAALAWYMESVEGEEALANQIRAIRTDECSEATRTSANKKKSLGTDEWTDLSAALLASHERHLEQFGTEEGSVPMATLCFLSATETTGMRPSEWWGTVMEMESDETEPGVVLDTIVLTVKNGKASNGRANGQNRTLRLRGLTEEKKLALLRHYRSVKQLSSEADFERYQKSCTSCMTYTTSKLWPTRKRKPSLYSGRHQVSANLKKDRVPLDVLAAIMGHATDRTATEHYGRRKYGRGNESMIEADPDDVSRVRQVAGERTSPDSPGRIGAGSNGPKMG